MPKPDIQDKKSKTEDNKEKKEQQEQQKVLFEFPDDEQQKIADMIAEDYETDKASRTEHMTVLQEILFLAEGKRESKNEPWSNCSNVNTMLTAVAWEIVHSKLLPAIWNENNLDWRCEDFAFAENANNIKKFMGWASRNVNFGQIVDDLTYDSVGLGTTAHKIRKIIDYKWVQRRIPIELSTLEKGKRLLGLPVKQKYRTKYEYIQEIRREIDSINLEDIYFPYHAKDEQRCDHLIHRFYRIYPEALDLERRGYWSNVEDKLSPNLDEMVLEGKRREDMDSEGIRKNESKRDTKPLQFLEWYGKYDYNGDKILEECVFTIHYNDSPYGNKATYICGKPLSAVSKIEKRPIVIGQYIRRSNRLLGKGLGHLVYNLHKQIDSIYNVINDAGTMSVNPFGVYTPSSGFDPAEIELAPGAWYPVDDINGIKWVVVPNNTLPTWEHIRFIISIIERLTSATPYQQGRESEVVKSGATATATVALIQEGQSMFVKTAKRLIRTIGKIAEMLLESYQEDLPPGLAERITGEAGEQLFPEGLSPEDIAGKYTCYLNIDTLAFNKAIRRSVDLQIYQGFLANPIVMSNPTYLWELSAMVLRSLEKEDAEIERIIGHRPNLTFAELDDAKEENMQMLAGRRVKPDMNEPLFEHLITHLALKQTEIYKEAEPEKTFIIDEHIEDTKLLLTMQLRLMSQQMQQQGGQVGQTPQGTPGVPTGNVPFAPTARRMEAPFGAPTGVPGAGQTAVGQGPTGGEPS